MTRRLGTPLYAMAEVGSTMDVARELAEQGAPGGACVIADRQTEGRGRSGRRWESPPGGLYLSFILRPSRPPDEWPSLSLVVGVALAEAVGALCQLDVSIRWPNDLLVNGRKLAGILIEAHTGSSGGEWVVVGIGLNLLDAPTGLDQPATALREHLAHPPTRQELAAALFRSLERRYEAWTVGGFSSIRPVWLERSSLIGEGVSVSLPNEKLEGQASDIDERGRLILRLDTGVQRSVDVGDVRLLRSLKDA